MLIDKLFWQLKKKQLRALQKWVMQSNIAIMKMSKVLAQCRSDGWNISFTFQPKNNPDLNVLDDGFFSSIQSLQHQRLPQNIKDLIRVVEDTFKAETYNR